MALTLMAVHAHPDDEVSTTGGLLARCAADGVRTVVVTCTNGELGDASNGAKPGEPGHDEASVVAARRLELEESCRILQVSDLELLGFHDSGMAGWSNNTAPGAFASIPVDQAAVPLVRLIERYRPQVVVTYDANGFYGHPDHIQAHRITLAAIEATDVVDKVYFPAFPRSGLPLFREALERSGIDPPDVAEDEQADFGVPDETIAVWLDCSAVVDKKHAALLAHRSQVAETFWAKIPRELFDQMFSVECYVRHLDRTSTPVPEDDLFAGLR